MLQKSWDVTSSECFLVTTSRKNNKHKPNRGASEINPSGRRSFLAAQRASVFSLFSWQTAATETVAIVFELSERDRRGEKRLR